MVILFGIFGFGGETCSIFPTFFKVSVMGYNKDLIISDSSKLPSEWWNYLVNPIVGYYIPKTNLNRKRKH